MNAQQLKHKALGHVLLARQGDAGGGTGGYGNGSNSGMGGGSSSGGGGGGGWGGSAGWSSVGYTSGPDQARNDVYSGAIYSGGGGSNAYTAYLAQLQAEAEKQAAAAAEAQRQEQARQEAEAKAAAEAKSKAEAEAYQREMGRFEEANGVGVRPIGSPPPDHPDSPAYTGAGWATASPSKTAKNNIAQLTAYAERNWSDLSDQQKQELNKSIGRPASYGTDESSGWKDKFHDLLSPSPGGALYDLGVRGPGVTFDAQREQESRVDGLEQARYDQTNNVVKRLGNMALSAVPGAGAAMTVAKGIDAVQNKGMSVGDAIKNGLYEIGGGLVAGEINKAALKGIAGVSIDAAKGIVGYNQLAGLVNLGEPGALPSFNPGGAAVGLAGKAAGVTGFGEPTGMTNPDTGASIPNYVGGGFGSVGGGGGASVTAPVAPEAPTAPTPSQDYTPWKFDGKSFGKSVRAGASKRYGGA